MAKKIGVDIGHGSDTWKNGGGKGVIVSGKLYEEHTFNAEVGKLVDKRLKEHGFQTVLGQPPNKPDVPLITRTNKYNAQKVDLVVSIHANSATPSAHGAGSFYWHTAKDSKKVASIWLQNWLKMVDGVGQYGTGIIASVPNTWTDFHICRETHMTAILIEHGFMTNANDFQYIFGSKKSTYIKQCAEVIVKTVCDYFGVTYKKPSTSTPKPAPKPSQPSGETTYTVKKGDTFWSIAQKYGISSDAIQKANPKVVPTRLQIGQKLVIPTTNSQKYTIRKGDTFWSIAQGLKCSVDDIQKLNPKVDPKKLQVGQIIMVPIKK